MQQHYDASSLAARRSLALERVLMLVHPVNLLERSLRDTREVERSSANVQNETSRVVLRCYTL